MNILQHDVRLHLFPRRTAKRTSQRLRETERRNERSAHESSQSRGISGRVPERALCSQSRYFSTEKEWGRWFAVVKNRFPSFLLERIDRAARTANSRWGRKKGGGQGRVRARTREKEAFWLKDFPFILAVTRGNIHFILSPKLTVPTCLPPLRVLLMLAPPLLLCNTIMVH